MQSPQKHIVVVGSCRSGRRETFQRISAPDAQASCHARLRGPYSGVQQILAELVPNAHANHPELVNAHRIELLIAAPELERAIGPRGKTLVDSTPPEERTRFFGAQLIRSVSHGLITFILQHARLTRAGRGRALVLAFDDVDQAEPTAQEFLALMLRRANSDQVRLMLGMTGQDVPAELAAALVTYAERAVAQPGGADDEQRSAPELVCAYVASDGTSDDPTERAAYEAAPPAARARLHDERAAELERHGHDSGLRLGAIPYHRERGSDPAGAGRRALREALEHCVATGYSAATVDFGMRGRAVCDPVLHQHDYCHFTAKAASALVPLGRVAESLGLYRELRRRYTLAQVHMTCAYAIAMLHTRFLTPRDHDQALEWANSGRALGGAERDPIERAYFEVFADNGIALIEMHRGDLGRALELVTAGIERLERELPEDSYIVHRSQLLHNRARVLVALGRLDEAYADFTRLIEWDPFYVEYHSDRAGVHRRRGNLTAALSDYDQAVAVSVPLAELHFSRASVRAQAGLAREAIADLDYVLEMEPEFRDAHLARGTLRLDLGETEAAGADARAGLEVTPGDARLLCLLAQSQQAAGAREEACGTFDHALEVNPDFTPALVNRAVVAFELGNLDAAESDLTRALQQLGDDADVLYNRGYVRQHRRRFTAAVDDFTRAIVLPNADHGELLCRRAECYVALGEPALAGQDLLRLRELGDAERARLVEGLLSGPSAGSESQIAAAATRGEDAS